MKMSHFTSVFCFLVTYEFSYFRQGRLDFMDMIQEAMAHNKHISDYKFDGEQTWAAFRNRAAGPDRELEEIYLRDGNSRHLGV